MLVDFLAKRLSLLRIGERKFQCSRSNAQGLCCDPNASATQGFHGEFEAKTIFPDPVRLGDLDVLEHQRMGVGATDAEFVLLGTELESRHVPLHNQSIDASVTFLGIGLCDHEVGRGGVAVGDPVFGAVEQVVVPHVHSGCAL